MCVKQVLELTELTTRANDLYTPVIQTTVTNRRPG